MESCGWENPTKMRDSAWDPDLMKAFENMGDFRTSTFKFARADGISGEPANMERRHSDRSFPVDHISRWAGIKQGKDLTALSQLRKGKRAVGGDEAPGSPFRPIVDCHEIRVLEIFPGDFDDDLNGTLHHCSAEFEYDDQKPYNVRHYRTRYALAMEDLLQPVWYTALSYTWGTPNPSTDSIFECDGFEINITRTLDVALRHFRQTGYSINMWIDQICIDQSNTREKEQQIPLMSRIYKNAVNTVVWLGEATEGSANAFELLKFIGTVFQMEVDAPPPEDFERLCLPSAHDPIWKHLWDLVNRAWFKRLWIIQECILSDNLWVMCGGNTPVHWEELTNGFSNAVRSGLADWLQSEHGQTAGWSALHVLSEERIHYHHFQQQLTLFGTLARTRTALASDPRDKVYGLLGVCDAAGLQVSYDADTTVADVYHTATLKCLKSGIEYLLPTLCSVDHESEFAGLPSWVPDWSRRRQTSSFGFSTSSGAIYNAAANWKPCFSTRRPGERELLVPGKIFDVIENVAEACTVPDIACDDPQTANRHLVPWVELAQQCYPYPSGCGLFDAFWHTLVAGTDGEGRGKSPALFAEIFSLLLDETTGKSRTFPDQTYSRRQLRPRGKGRLELANLRTRVPAKTYQGIRGALRRAMRNRRLCVTERRYLGVVPGQAKAGDVICVLAGCHVPFVIRRAEAGKFRLVGECYVHGIMDGEVMEMGDVPHTSIVLV